METQQLNELFNRYLENRCTAQEIEILVKYFEVENDGFLRELIIKELASEDGAGNDQRLQYLADEVYKEITAKINGVPEAKEKNTIKLWFRIGITAAAAAAITLSAWLYISRYSGTSSSRTEGRDFYYSDIAPGKNTATLTVNGKLIQLSDAKTGLIVANDKLTYNDGSGVGHFSLIDEKTAEEQSREQTLTTPRGGTYQVTLSDGTHVWLNAASSLTYSASLNERGGARRVKLSGEAYFEVAKVVTTSGKDGRNPERVPFIVESNGQQVTVLGTHFNISAYSDDTGIRTTLLEGAVRVDKDGEAVTLKPNQQSIVNQNPGITVKDVDAIAAVDWKEGVFAFNKASLEEILKKIARWYNVDIVDQRKQKSQITFTGKMSRYDNISKVLSKLALTDEVKFKIEGKKVIVL